MKISVYCNGKVLNILEDNSNLPVIGEWCNYETYNPKTKIYSLKVYEVIGVSPNRIDLSPLFI